MVVTFPSKSPKARKRARRQTWRWQRDRNNALYRASNGEHLPRREREKYDLPDWTA